MKAWRPLLAWLLAAAALAWVLHGLDAHAFLRGVAAIRWSWVAAGLAFDVLSYLCQGWRWSMLFPARRLSPLQATRAIYIGLFANELFPLRLGEFIRAYLASRWTGLGLAAVVPTLALERLMDAVWLAAGIAASAFFVPLPPLLRRAAWILAAVAVLGLLTLLALLLRPAAGTPFLRRFQALRTQLRDAARSGALWRGFAASGAILAAQILAFWAIQRACSLPFGLGVAAVVLLVVHLGTAIPNAPANVGTYQFFVVLGLSLFGAAKSAAAAFSLVVFVLLTLPLWLLGFLALRSTGGTFSQLRRETLAAA